MLLKDRNGVIIVAHIVRTKNGNKIVLRNPAEKGKRYARQMKSGFIQETGEKLNDKGYAYRAGYLDSRRDSAKAYKSNKKKRK